MIPFDPNQPKREIRITSRNFVHEGETGEPDAYLSNEDRAALGIRLDPLQTTDEENTACCEMLRSYAKQVPKK